MNFLIPFILVSFYVNYEVSCIKVFNYMSDKMNDFKKVISNLFQSFKNRVKFLIFPEIDSEDRQPMWEHFDIKSKIKKAFSDFVAEEAAQSETESPEYTSLRLEPTALMSTPQLATLHGKRIESHVVLTKDGYLLTLHRLRSPFITKEENENNIRNFTILMHHGLLGSSADWILLGPEKSLPYILSSAGCDVWLTNARGNYYSRGHTSQKIDSLDYWKFSWQEMGVYDLPAVVDYIKNIKNSTEQLNYIGHSMGATAFLVMLSSYPNYNKNFRMGILLAPLVYMTNVEGPMKILTTMAKSPPEQLLKFLGEGEFVPNRKIPLWIANKYCKGPELYCVNPLLFLSGSIPEKDSWDKSLIARVLYHIPAGGSTDTILHFAQMVKSGKFHKFYDENEEFPLQYVTVPIALFSSSDDWLATIPDVLRLYFSIANPIDHFVIRGKKLTHTDFIWNPEADNLVFEKVVDCLENGLIYNMSKKNEV